MQGLTWRHARALADYERTAIKSMLPEKPRGVPRVFQRSRLRGLKRRGAPIEQALDETQWRRLMPASGETSIVFIRAQVIRPDGQITLRREH